MTSLGSLTIPGSFRRLSTRFGDGVFTPAEAEPILGEGIATYLELSRLTRLGWLLRVGRGRYANADPVGVITPGAVGGLRAFRSKCYYPILQRAVGGILRVYGGRLIGIVLFGSAARGAALPRSDIDLAVFADRVPNSVGEEAAETRLTVGSVDPLVVEEWERVGHYHVPSVLSATPEAFESPGRVMLGVVADGRILYDPAGEVAAGIEQLRRRFRATGVRERRTRDGRTYWEVGTMFDQEATA